MYHKRCALRGHAFYARDDVRSCRWLWPVPGDDIGRVVVATLLAGVVGWDVVVLAASLQATRRNPSKPIASTVAASRPHAFLVPVTFIRRRRMFCIPIPQCCLAITSRARFRRERCRYPTRLPDGLATLPQYSDAVQRRFT